MSSCISCTPSFLCVNLIFTLFYRTNAWECNFFYQTSVLPVNDFVTDSIRVYFVALSKNKKSGVG